MKRFLPLLIVTSVYSQWFSVAGCNNNGDLDGNGELEIGDIAAIQNLILEAGYSEIADANTDGKLSVTDLIHALDWFENDSYSCFQRFIFDDDTLDADVSPIVLQDVNGDYLSIHRLYDENIGWFDGFLKLDGKGYPIDSIAHDYEPPRYFIEDVGEGYVVGSHNGDNSDADIRIVKIDYDGNLIWENSYANDSNIKQIINTFDEGYAVIADYSSPQGSAIGITVFKLHPSGSLEWIVNYDDFTNNSRALSIIQRPDSGFVSISNTSSANDGLFTTQIDKNGNFESSISLFGDNSWGGHSYGGIIYNDGHYYLLVGDYLMKFDTEFNYISYFNVGLTVSSGYGIWPQREQMIIKNNIFSLVGAVNNGPLGSDFSFMKYNLEGELINSSLLELFGNQSGQSLCATNDGGYFISIKGFGYGKTDSTGQVPVWLLDT